jgi:hypothetical protein
MSQENSPGHFPGVRVKPLCHLSTGEICRTDALPGQADSCRQGGTDDTTKTFCEISLASPALQGVKDKSLTVQGF